MESTGTPSTPPVTPKRVAAFVTVLAAVILVTLFVPPITDQYLRDHAGPVVNDVAKSWTLTILNPVYWTFVLLIGLLELRWAAREGEGMLSTGARQDFIWLLLAPVFSLTIVAYYLDFLNWLYTGPLHSASLDVQAVLGLVVTAVLAYLLADLLMWLSHLIRHKVKPLWRFHQVHHSQTQMSVLNDNRVHFVESIVSATIAYIPARLLGLSNEASTALAFTTTFFTGFAHANLRTNLGPLRWVLVTPQSHRVHHSIEEGHWDSNFGATLSIWDRIFRTQHPGTDEYPAIGIDDPTFPLEQRVGTTSMLRNYVAQVVHPFRMVVRDVRGSTSD